MTTHVTILEQYDHMKVNVSKVSEAKEGKHGNDSTTSNCATGKLQLVISFLFFSFLAGGSKLIVFSVQPKCLIWKVRASRICHKT